MNDMIVSTLTPITAIGGGDASADQLLFALGLAPVCVAADGGAALALRAGIMPEAVIGDFDSLPPHVLARIPAAQRHVITEQLSTDFEKVLLRVRTPVMIGVGFLGGRLDHELAALHALLGHADQPCVLLGDGQIVFLAPPVLKLPAQAGDLVSLFPLTAVRGRSHGLKWPIEGLAFEPGLKIGTSNAATGPFEVEMDAPGMLIILPDRFMPDVVAAFLQPDRARWPVRAG